VAHSHEICPWTPSAASCVPVGIAVTEYGLLVALIAVLLIGVVSLFGSQIKSWFEAKTGTITTV
jgi:Flp pilus assembly pilin Flp